MFPYGYSGTPRPAPSIKKSITLEKGLMSMGPWSISGLAFSMQFSSLPPHYLWITKLFLWDNRLIIIIIIISGYFNKLGKMLSWKVEAVFLCWKYWLFYCSVVVWSCDNEIQKIIRGTRLWPGLLLAIIIFCCSTQAGSEQWLHQSFPLKRAAHCVWKQVW